MRKLEDSLCRPFLRTFEVPNRFDYQMTLRAGGPTSITFGLPGFWARDSLLVQFVADILVPAIRLAISATRNAVW
jgi:hypothetical protein